MHKSIATIDSPEFINLQPLEINPLMSSCEIKVLYIGENRNRSFISKEVAEDMAKSLRGAPIVGYYKEEKEDFADHGHRMILDDEGVKFECMTKPYGFVAPDAKVWFQKFEDTDDFGNVTVREYMMTTGYLWTGQFEECKDALSEGRPQSMELDENSLDGHWAQNNKTGMDFFIINDAIFSKLCILGDDVEPCFEGANVTTPEISKSFTLMDDTFKNTLFSMIQDLQIVIEGGQNMEVNDTEVINEEVVEETVVEVEENLTENDNSEQSIETENQDSIEAQSNQEENTTIEEEVAVEEETVAEEEVVEETSSEEVAVEEYAKKEDDEEDKEEDSEENKEEEDDEDKKKKDYSLLETEFAALQEQYSNLEKEYQALVEFKKSIEDKEKDALIAKFFMLSDEDKADVIENKANYSLDEIEAKLSVICVRKKVSFELEASEEEKEETAVTTFTLEDENAGVPAYVSALRNFKNKNKNN